MKFHWNSQLIPISIWLSPQTKKVHSIIFLGIVQINKLPFWVAKDCPPGFAVIQGVPYWFARSDGSDMPDLIYDFAKQTFRFVCKNMKINSCNIIAESQAAPGAIRIAIENQNICENTILIQPLGLTTQSFLSSDRGAFAEVQRRSLENLRHQLPFFAIDRKLLYNYAKISRSAVRKTVKNHYNSGLSHNAIDELQKLSQLGNVQIICGADDKLFPPDEIRMMLAKNEIGTRITIVENVPHSPFASKQGRKLLAKSIDIISNVI